MQEVPEWWQKIKECAAEFREPQTGLTERQGSLCGTVGRGKKIKLAGGLLESPLSQAAGPQGWSCDWRVGSMCRSKVWVCGCKTRSLWINGQWTDSNSSRACQHWASSWAEACTGPWRSLFCVDLPMQGCCNLSWGVSCGEPRYSWYDCNMLCGLYGWSQYVGCMCDMNSSVVCIADVSVFGPVCGVIECR